MKFVGKEKHFEPENMCLKDSHCGLCGKEWESGWTLQPFNIIGQEPYFCSQRCLDKIGHFYYSEKDLEVRPPDSIEDMPFVFHEGELKKFETYTDYAEWWHPKEEAKRIVEVNESMQWSRDFFITRWRIDKKAHDKKLVEDDSERRYERIKEELRLEKCEATMPDEIPYRIRNEHEHVVAGTGAGKTTLLTHRFLGDIFDPRQPAIIILDGKGTWAPALQRFACFAPDRVQSERLIIINPQDKQPAALNMFATTDRSLIDGVSENLAYIFGSRDYELSAKMRTAFTYAAQLMFALENPTIETLLALMRDPVMDPKTGGIPASSQFRNAIDQQPPINKRFFHELFYHPTEFQETKRQIQNRIYDLLSCRAFSGMFMQQENRLDMHDVMQNGKILIVDSSPGAVGEKAASSFGRYIISLALSTARARINIPRDQWRQTFLYIDEAQLFVDEERTQPLLQQAREFNLGVILSHQKLADLTPALKATFAGNTSSKYCANPSADDARDMAKDMRTDAEFILSQRHRDGYANFATFIRGMTEHAVSHGFKLGVIDDTPKMSDEQYRDIMTRNRTLMSPPPRPKQDVPVIPSLAASIIPPPLSLPAITDLPTPDDADDNEW